jgi:hypothetical protein
MKNKPKSAIVLTSSEGIFGDDAPVVNKPKVTKTKVITKAMVDSSSLFGGSSSDAFGSSSSSTSSNVTVNTVKPSKLQGASSLFGGGGFDSELSKDNDMFSSNQSNSINSAPQVEKDDKTDLFSSVAPTEQLSSLLNPVDTSGGIFESTAPNTNSVSDVSTPVNEVKPLTKVHSTPRFSGKAMMLTSSSPFDNQSSSSNPFGSSSSSVTSSKIPLKSNNIAVSNNPFGDSSRSTNYPFSSSNPMSSSNQSNNNPFGDSSSSTNDPFSSSNPMSSSNQSIESSSKVFGNQYQPVQDNNDFFSAPPPGILF